MTELLYEHADLSLYKKGERYFVRYDAGAHEIVMREDEVSLEEALEIVKGPSEAEKVLITVQARLQKAGLNPYISNIRVG